MRKVKSSKIYTQEWHRTRRVDPMEGIAKMRCRWGGCCNDIRGWFSTGWIRKISSHIYKRQFFFFLHGKKYMTSYSSSLSYHLLFILNTYEFTVFMSHFSNNRKKYPRFFQSRPNPSLFVTQKRKERKGNFGGKKIWRRKCSVHISLLKLICVSVYSETRMWYTHIVIPCVMHARARKKFKLAKSGDLTLYPLFLFLEYIIPNAHTWILRLI